MVLVGIISVVMATGLPVGAEFLEKKFLIPLKKPCLVVVSAIGASVVTTKCGRIST